ncbi:hypothetical protein [Effusibacillus dendaii]|uniref:Copper amine oxidase-like N-terminal domain-containing protein n=1 Tax=Effusibacillus dendaii TaxID=2743772 RepID=A0A7I8DDB2_9BACL|nr:hypothetical protein [Effusibacillus dendaii]BCJ85881.1 hypothetical protein skT53_08660 [Effusibacillus dendaii]
MIGRILLVGFLTACLWPMQVTTAAETGHSQFMIQNIPVQLPYMPLSMGDDTSVDVYSLKTALSVTVETRKTEYVIRYQKHQLEVEPGRAGALLDGKWLLLKHPPVKTERGLLLPQRQLFDLLTVPYHEANGHYVIDAESKSIADLQKTVEKTESVNRLRVKIGFIGVIQPDRWLVAATIITGGQPVGFGNLYEAARETKADGTRTWKLTKLRTISDTANRVYMEWMKNGSIFENLASDKRPEFLVVETCGCTGQYQYGTMFSLTEMGFVPVWHSQSAYAGVQQTKNGWDLITYRRDAVPNRTIAAMPYWEIHETWDGQSFVVNKQEYRDPLK